MAITLEQAITLLRKDIGANNDGATQLNLVSERYLNSCDPPGSLERVTFTVTADADGQGFITLDARYSAIRGAVENPTSTSPCGYPLQIRNSWYEYTPGNLGMIKSSDPLRGIIPIPKAEGDTLVKYKVPTCPPAGSQTFFTAICKLAFIQLENDTDVLPVQNLGALSLGLKAIAKEDASDFARADQLWNQGKTLLMQQKDNDTGPEAQGKVQIDDDFQLANLGEQYGYGWGYGWGGGWWNG
jgi:hypothetical protein